MELSKLAMAIQPSATMALDAKAKQMKAEGLDVLSFSVGEPDFDTPDYIKKAGIDAINTGKTKYVAASGTPALRKAIAEKLKRENNLDYKFSDIVAVPGAKTALSIAFMCILNAGDEVIIPAPYWVSYVEQVSIAGGKSVIIDTTENGGFKASVADFEKALTAKTKAIIINSPNNPTGSVYSKYELQAIADFAVKNDLYVISDEVYEHFNYSDEPVVSIASLGEEIKDRTIIVGAGSKTYSMPGWRLGFLASNSALAKAFGNIASHLTGCLSSITDMAGVEAFSGDLEEVHKMKAEFVKRREYLLNRIDEISGLSIYPPKGAFYAFINIQHFIDNNKFKTSSEFCDKLLDEEKIALTPGDAFGADGFIRFSFAASQEDIQKGLDRLEKFCKKYY